MKKGKVFHKKQIVIAAMVLALGGAIWLNMKYSAGSGGFNTVSSSNKNLGDTKYVMEEEAVETAANADYLAEYKSQRETARNEAIKLVEETLSKTNLSAEEKKAATEKIEQEAQNVLSESNIETTLKAKGFNSSLVMISGENATVIVKSSDGLTSSETLQIQDAVIANSKIELSNIKIVTVK